MQRAKQTVLDICSQFSHREVAEHGLSGGAQRCVRHGNSLVDCRFCELIKHVPAELVRALIFQDVM